MANKATLEQLITCLIQVIGRTAMPAENVRALVGTGRTSLRAYNLCDGTRLQRDIVKKLKMDSGNFSRTVRRWIEAGIAFDIGGENESRILHIYPLQENEGRPAGASNNRRRRAAKR
jgi:hypothetical protein